MVELHQSMESELAFVHKHIDLVLQELLAVFLHLLRHGCAEHHDLFFMRSLDEDVLDLSSHFRVRDDLVTLINHKVFALS